MRFSLRFTFPLFQIEPGDPGAGGAPSGGAATGTPPATTTAPPAGGTPGAGGTPPAATTPAASSGQFSYAEDRSKWLPPYRLNEERTRFQQLERQHEQLNQRVRALMGLEQPQNPKIAEIRSALTEIAPELGPVLSKGKSLEKLLQLVESGALDQVLESGNAQWNRHAFQVTSDAVKAFATATGTTVDKLGQRAEERISRELFAFIGADKSRQQRYEMGDPALVSEFIADLTGFWVTPLRPAQNTAGAQLTSQNRRLPQQGPRGGVPQGGGATDGAKKSRAEISKAAREFVAQQGQ